MGLTVALGTDVFKKSSHRIFVLPHYVLKRYIAHYTYFFGCDNGGEPLTLVPDASGCMIFEVEKSRLKCLIWGPTTNTVVVGNKPNDIELRIFVEFLPCGLYRLTGIDVNEITDLKLKLDSIMPDFEKEIQNLFELSSNTADFTNGLNQLFIQRLNAVNTNDFGISLIDIIHETGHKVTVKQLCENVYYSERHINRILSSELGLNAKNYIRLLRINKALQLIKNKKYSLTELSQQIGFYDQAHFIHDFKEVCGVTPTIYKNNMSNFYNEDFKF